MPSRGQRPKAHLIAPTLLTIVVEFAEQVADGKIDLTELSGSHPLVLFLESLMSQFGTSQQRRLIGFNGFTLGQLRNARRLLEAEEDLDEAGQATQLLLLDLEEACERLPEIWYADDGEDRDWFFYDLIPRVLEHLSAWADGVGDEILSGAVANAINEYGGVTD